MQKTFKGPHPDLANQIAGKLDHLALLHADRAIDDARRLIWLSTFSGSKDEDVTLLVKPSATAVTIAGDLKGLQAMVAMIVLENARLIVWGAQFTAAEWSRYAQELKKTATKPARPVDKTVN